ncbi:hypothetical protein C479_08573 [Halovivax asiaticus JCM 14624]|uniref:Uncharacterized protein n=1 Tax=Halovivax asiaticus JCM 14624 TaxID=1227490 RepID=M0BK49_9EURY|nr:hypothetical protein [Halovivax asiaticus]ELZ10852.1 hypothetical protein C479_08573 [Halovivax asiaticus JCM 14624]
MPRTESTADASTDADDASETADSPPTESGSADPPTGPDDPIGHGPLTPESWRKPLHDERALRKATSAVLGGLAIIVVLFLLSLLPGLNATGDAFAALANGILAASLAAVLGYVAMVIPWYVRSAFDGPREVREPGVTATVWALVLAAVLTLHRGFVPLVTLVDGPMWLYDGLFLLAALVPVAFIARALWEMVDPAASYLTGRLTDE